MNLLFDDIEVIESVGDPSSVEVGGITHDSRRVVPGDLFCCVPGTVSDGHTHAAEAVDRGAIGLLCEHLIPELIDHDVVQTRIAEGTMRPVMARLAAAFYGYPARDLLMVGVTGTNGKTTVTQLLGDLLTAAGRPTNVMGTLSGTRTTPEATEVQRVLAGVRDRQKSDGQRHAVAMEVSSHALVQSRVEGIHFDVAVFTNLSHDHLDYHGTMEEYFEAKALLFTPSHALRGVVNADDSWGRRLLERVAHPDGGRPPRRRQRHRAAARPFRIHLARTADHHTLDRRHQRGQRPVGGRGRAGARGAVPRARGDRARHGQPLAGAGTAAGDRHTGRAGNDLECGESGGPTFTVLVDYAHTPAGWRSCSARPARSRPGAGCSACSGAAGTGTGPSGPLMGAAATQLSDLAFLTSDNPRDEEPLAIIEEVLGGIPEGRRNPRVTVEPDRGVAIRRALDAAEPGDVVVIAGKGHETYQEIAGHRLPFDDAVEARQALSVRFSSDPRTWTNAPSSSGVEAAAPADAAAALPASPLEA